MVCYSLMISIFILFILVMGFPFWTGDIIYPGGKIIPSARVIVPAYYSQASNWINTEQSSFRMVSIPLSNRYLTVREWESGFYGVNPNRWLFLRPDLNSGKNQIILFLGKEIDDLKYTPYTGKIFPLINRKYIIFQNDTNWEYIKDHPWWLQAGKKQLVEFLNSQKIICLEKSFGQLDFYKISDDYFLPPVSYTHLTLPTKRIV